MKHAALLTPFTAIVLSSSFYTPAWAFNEEDILGDIPEVTSVTRISQNLSELPASATIITQDLIQASGIREIPELMRLVPGFQVYTPNFNKYAVTYHGASGEFPNDLDIRIDGRPVYIPLLSTVSWNTLGITVDDIQHIEVVRGSNVPSYGSNALMGAINIVTKSPVEHQRSSVSSALGSNGTKKVNSTFRGHNDSLFYKVSLSHEQNEGFDFQNDGENVNGGNLQLTYSPSLFDTIEFNAGFSHGRMGVGEGLGLEDFGVREHHSHYQHLRWNHIADENNEFNIQLYHNYLDLSAPNDWASEVIGDPGLIGINTQLQIYAHLLGDQFPFNSTHVSDFLIPRHGEVGRTQTIGGEVQHTYKANADLTIASGLGFRYEKAESAMLFTDRINVDEEVYFIFSNAEWKAQSDLTLNAGFMTEFSSKVDPATSLRLAANYSVNDHFVIRAAATQAYRTPSLLEENQHAVYSFPEGVPFDHSIFANDDLESEKLRAGEIGAIWRLPEYSGYIDFKLFYEDISGGIGRWFFLGPMDLVSAGQGFTDEVRENRNTIDYHAQGFEVGASFKPTENDTIHFAYAYNNINGISRQGEIQDNTDRSVHDLKTDEPMDNRAPLHTASLLLNHKFSDTLDASLTFYHTSNVFWDASNNRSGDEIDSIDLKVTKAFKVGQDRALRIGLLTKNLLDEEYTDFQVKNVYGRRYFLTFSVDI